MTGSSTMWMPVAPARWMIDMSMAAAMAPSMSSVVAAFFDLGRWKLGTPLEMASTPVRAAQPEEKALRMRKAPASPVSPESQPGPATTSKAADWAWPSVPMASWTNPVTARAPIAIM